MLTSPTFPALFFFWYWCSAEKSKELISGTYKFNVVAENALVEDYVTEKFYEGLKSGSLMVWTLWAAI